MTKNFMCLFSIKRMWELGNSVPVGPCISMRFVPSLGQSVEMSLPLKVKLPIAARSLGERLSSHQRVLVEPGRQTYFGAF